MFEHINITPIITNIQKISLHTGSGYLATRQERPNLPYLVQ